jgi:hypothetical protein
MPATHGEKGKPHGKTFAVCLRTANNTRQRTPRQTTYAVCNSKNARQTICRVLPPLARHSKAPNTSQTSTEIRGGPEIQFAVSLAFVVRCAVRLRLSWALRAPVCRVPVLCRVLHWICHGLGVAVCRGIAFCRVLFLCHVPDIPGWQQISS